MAPGESRALPAEGYAALVGGAAPGPGVTVILRSDVLFWARLLEARRGGDPAAGEGRRLPEDLLQEALDQLVAEALVATEAGRVGVPDPRASEVADALRQLEEWAGGPEPLRALAREAGLVSDDLRDLARRRARVQSFLEANLEGEAVVSDARLRQVWSEGAHPFTDAPSLEAVRGMLRAWIARQALSRALLRWVRVLRGRIPVRILVPWPKTNVSGEPGTRAVAPG
ncbi:MAG TPA: hypothetical protein RMF84_06940 [Polyangiaceae bacterium LLY-WYZ-14_1]|nr:hypothetical protein [Polyangiaceae bacterium LLY-WYZ-14_1]